MIFFLKFIHLFGLMLGAAAGFGSMALARQARRDGASAQLDSLRRTFTTYALTGIVLLWASGLGLWLVRYDLVGFGWPYDLKLGLALLLLIASALLFRHARQAKGPPAGLMRRVSLSTPFLLLGAVGLGAWIFL